VSRVVGIDLGGTKVAAAVLDGFVFEEPVIHPTALSSSEELLDQLVEVAGEARGSGRLDAVGIGVPSIVEFATGRVVSSVNIPLVDVPLREVLGSRLGVPVFVDNDATVAALAEAHDEDLKLVAENLVMLTIGTGLGGGIVLGGRIFRGSTGAAGEIGHTLVGLPVGEVEPGEPFAAVPLAGDDFPQHGSLEWLAAGHALDRLAVATIGPDAHGVDVVNAALGGSDQARQAVTRWARMIGVGIANAINTFDPQEVVIGGGAAAAGEHLLKPAVEFANGYVVPGLRGHCTVRLARFGPRAGVLGAALLAQHEFEDGDSKSGGNG
jgi:glucokinase